MDITQLDVWKIRRPLVKLPIGYNSIDVKTISDPIGILNNFHSIDNVDDELRAFISYQMLYEKEYADESEATERFTNFRETLHECQEVALRCKSAATTIGITDVADLTLNKRKETCNIKRDGSKRVPLPTGIVTELKDLHYGNGDVVGDENDINSDNIHVNDEHKENNNDISPDNENMLLT